MINFEDITQEIEYYLSHLNDDGFRISIKYEILTPANIKVVLVKIWKGTDQLSYRSSDIFKFNEISDDIYRFIDNISNRFRFGYIYTMRRPKYWEDGFDDGITLYRQEYELEQVTKNDDLGQIKLFSMCLIPQSKVKESLNIPKFKDFISKYKKSQYISSNSIKSMKDKTGIDYDDFKSINDSVNNVFKFFRKCDDDTFSDILQYVIDDLPAISNITIRHNINVDASSSIIMDPFDFVIDKGKSEIDATDIIVCWVEQLREKQIKEDSLTNVDYDYNSDFKKNRRKMRDEIIDHIKSDECIGRYLSAIGYGGVTYNVTINPWVYGEMFDDIEIKVKINLMSK